MSNKYTNLVVHFERYPIVDVDGSDSLVAERVPSAASTPRTQSPASTPARGRPEPPQGLLVVAFLVGRVATVALGLRFRAGEERRRNTWKREQHETRWRLGKGKNGRPFKAREQ